MNEYYTSGGIPIRNREGRLLMAELPGTPSTLGGSPQLAVTAPDDIGGRDFSITLTVPLDPSITELRINSYGHLAGEPAGYECGVPESIIELMHAGAGTFLIPGLASDLLDPLDGMTASYVEVIARNSAGWGLIRDLWEINAEAFTFEPFVVTANPVITSSPLPLVGGTPLTYTQLQWTGEDGVVVAHVMRRAEDASGTNPGSAEPISPTVPFHDGTLSHMRIEATAIGNGVANPLTVYASDWVELAADENEGTAVEVDELPLMASNRLLVDGITDDSFEPYDTLTAGGASATIVAFVPETSELFLGPITGGPIADDAAVTSSSGGAAVANGASAAWVPAGGEPYYLLAPTFTGTPASVVLLEYIRDDSDDAIPTLVELAGGFPPHYGTKQYRATWRYTGLGIDTYEEVSIDWLNIGIPTLEPLADDAWLITVEAEPGGGDRVTGIHLRDDIVTNGAGMWTTGDQAQIDANPFPWGHEPTTLGGTSEIEGTTYRLHATADAIHGTPPKNYVVFGSGDEDRRQRFGFTVPIGGAWTPLGARKTVPVADEEPTELGDFVALAFGSQTQAEQGDDGGSGMQYVRPIDGDGDYLIVAFDVTYPSESFDYGNSWHSDGCNGLYMHQSCMGLVVDGDFVHGMFGALYMGQSNASYDDACGIYRKSRSADAWTRTKQLTDVYGTNKGPMRVNARYIAKVAGSGSGPTTRTLFAIHAPAAYNSGSSGFSTIQVLKSTAGGAPGTWANDGSALNVSTHGIPREIWADSIALYINTTTRVIRRPVAGGSWVVATGLPAGDVLHFEKHGSKVYACVKGKGLYWADDAATLAFTLKKSFNILSFAVCPTNTDRITLIGAAQVTPIGTHDGGATPWFNIATQPYPGQPNTFAHKLHGPGCQVRYHDTDPNVVWAMLFQHMGKSTDGGRTFFWSSKGFTYSKLNGVCCHPTDPLRMFTTMTDRLATAFEHGAAFVHAGGTSASDLDTIDGILGKSLSAHTAAGPLVMTRNGHTVYAACIGENVGAKVPVIFYRGHTVTESDKPTTGNGAISVTVSSGVPGGEYRLTCITAAANGGIFRATGPLGENLGNVVVGTPTTLSPSRGGTINVTISDGSVDHKAGQNPKVFTIDVEPLETNTILNLSNKNVSSYGQTNPAVNHRGFTGPHLLEINTSGVASSVRSIPYIFAGYMGSSGNVILATSGNSTLMRSINEGVGFSQWATGLPNFSPLGGPVVAASHHDDQRAYTGTGNGRVMRIQNGVRTEIFSFDAWCTANGISGDWPGHALVNGRYVPPVTGVAESWFDPNLLYCTLHLYGERLQLFRTKNALAASPTWENITAEDAPAAAATIKGKGLPGPLYGCDTHRHYDDIFCYSQHGTQIVRAEQAHRTAYGITGSLVDHLRSIPGLGRLGAL